MPRKPARTSIGVVTIDEFVSSVAMVATRSESALQKGICARCKAVIMRAAERGGLRCVQYMPVRAAHARVIPGL